MKALVKLFALLLVLAFSFSGLATVEAGVLPPCTSVCNGNPSYTHCSCPPGTPLVTRDTTCGAWQTFCQGDA